MKKEENFSFVLFVQVNCLLKMANNTIQLADEIQRRHSGMRTNSETQEEKNIRSLVQTNINK